jgi:uncharacterized membrane-anchored protein YhcB (DUF1043 family)
VESSIPEIPDWVYTTAVGLIIGIIVWLNRQRLGLGEGQLAQKARHQEVIDLQERQIELLKEEVEALRIRVAHLENIVDDYQRQVRFYKQNEHHPDTARKRA